MKPRKRIAASGARHDASLGYLRTLFAWASRGRGLHVGVGVALGAHLLLVSAGCGYRALAGNASERLCVVSKGPRVADWGAVRAALESARAELARAGALGPEGDYPCLVLEITRVTETATGVLVGQGPGRELPRARGTAVAVLGRAWVEAQPGAESSRDTGDMQRVARAPLAENLSQDSARHQSAAAAAGERLGRALARAILGFPTPLGELP